MCRNSSSSSASPSSCAVDGTSNSNQVVSNTRCRDKLQKVILAMKDVSYDIVVKTPKMNVCDKVVKTKKRLLHGINFYARKGTCNAVLGRSGAGKTTMIDILTGRRMKSSGQLYAPETVGYVAQTPTLYSTLTVKETFEFAAALKLPTSLSNEERAAKVNKCIELLGLSDRADTVIEGVGGMKTLSGGETRRVYVGRELVTLPKKSDVVLFLDEPTTGLDASSSRQLVALLCSLAENTGCTILMSVHNPRFNTFSLFHSVTILDMGYVVYCDIPQNLKSFLHDLGLDCPEQENIADFIIDVLSEGRPLPSSDVEGGSFEDNCKNALAKNKSPGAYKEKGSYLLRSPMKEIDIAEDSIVFAMHKKCSAGLEFALPDDLQLSYSRIQKRNASVLHTSMSLRIHYLLERSMRNLIRRPTLFRVVVISRIFMGLLMVLLYHNQPQSVLGLQNLSGLTFFSMLNNVFSMSAEACLLFIQELNIFREEGANHYYRPIEFFVTKIVAQSVLMLFTPATVYGTIVYFSVGYRPGFEYFAYYIFTLFLVVLCSCSLINMMMLISSKRLLIGQILAPTCLSIMVVFSGVFIRVSSLPRALRALTYISIFHLGYGSMMSNEVTGREYDCTELNDYTTIDMDSCTTISGDVYVEDFLGFPFLRSKWSYIPILCGYIFILNSILYLQLSRDLKWHAGNGGKW